MKFYFSILFTLLYSIGFSQDTIHLDQIIAVSLKKNYDILLTRNDSATAAIDYNLSYAAFLPRLNASAEKIWNSNNQQQSFQDGTKREQRGVNTSNVAAAVNLDWTLFDGLKMFATRDRVKELYEVGSLTVKQQIVESIASIITTYYNIVQQKQQLKAIEEQIGIYQERVTIADKKFSVGLGAKPELLQSQVDLNAQKAALLQRNTLIAQLKDQLNQLTGQQLPVLYEVVDTIPINLNLSLGDIRNNVEASNPSLLIAKKNISVAELILKERKAERLPTIAFTSSYNYSNQVNSVVLRPEFQALSNRNSGFNYGFTAAIPIFNNFLTRRNINVAKLGIQYQQLSFENQRSIINVALSNAFKNYEYQKQALQLEEENIRLAKENVSIAFERFRLGVTNNVELRDAQISLQQAYDRLIAARYNTKLAETELLRLKGDLVK